jgi:probable rRNA maturation factor
MPRGSLIVTVRNASLLRSVPPARRIEQWVRSAVGARRCGEIGVRVVTEEESAALNARYRGRQGPTNVLAFPGDMDLSGLDTETPLGDIVICAAVVEREAIEGNKDRDAHWAHIVVHGALHLIGFDHATPESAAEMESRETRVLTELGFSDPYSERARVLASGQPPLQDSD